MQCRSLLDSEGRLGLYFQHSARDVFAGLSLVQKQPVSGRIAVNTVIDTLRLSEKLQTSGFATEQANALARALADEMGEQLATRKDIERVEGEIKAIHLRLDNLDIRLNYLFALIGLLVALELIPVVRAFTG